MKSSADTFEFHIARKARDYYRFPSKLFGLTGNVIIADPRAVKKLVRAVNRRRPDTFLSAGKLNAMGLIDEILHYVITKYRREKNRGVIRKARAELVARISGPRLSATLKRFVETFPPTQVYRRRQTAPGYLRALKNQALTIEEMILLRLANRNPAFLPFREFFDDADLGPTDYLPIIGFLEEFFKNEPRYGPYNQPLFDLLQAPMIAEPDSLAGQLKYIMRHWSMLLAPGPRRRLTRRILISLDLLNEESRDRTPGDKSAFPTPDFTASDAGTGAPSEPEGISADSAWMPTVVMIAKHTHIWLDQLSKKYRRRIARLDEIPDAELDRIASWSINAIWLIGIWQRSEASREIKRRCGNPEAMASAYSIYDYEIAADLGGEESFRRLKERARVKGIRLAVDVVPNHTGIYSRWIIEHPDWFIQSRYAPFPRYRYTGPELSPASAAGIQIEDSYWTRTDAAVAFKYSDRRDGRARYIYHGNDGTSMPWNDTAQLDFMKAEVREAVIKKIVDVARKAPIIRLDAAMTLTKKHFQRLWYPEPGTGGAIPSRAECGLSRTQFERRFPKEFWREVVDRIGREAPDTLLLAEAFWLLEGYFVRTLGMHRVYNSAFMNMLKTEDNAGYRRLIRSIVTYNPQILKRFVNFLSNPDEETAYAQFGRDDKYFGTVMMMITLPGLVMFGHGQIEGLRERYGMEYPRAYLDEQPDTELLKRHEREVFPVLKKRHLFSGIENFRLHNFFAADGTVDENVFAYSNGDGRETALFIFNNRYRRTRGRVSSADFGKMLGIAARPGVFCTFRDWTTGLHYLRPGAELLDRGLAIELGAFKYHLFTGFRLVEDSHGDLRPLAETLAGQGTPDLGRAIARLGLEPLHDRYRRLIRTFMGSHDAGTAIADQMAGLHAALEEYRRVPCAARSVIGDFRKRLKVIVGAVPAVLRQYREESGLDCHLEFTTFFLFHTVVIRSLTRTGFATTRPDRGAHLIDELAFGEVIAETAGEFGLNAIPADGLVALLKILAPAGRRVPLSRRSFGKLLDERTVREYLKVHESGSITWFNRERMEILLAALVSLAAIDRAGAKGNARRTAFFARCAELVRRSGFRFERLVASLAGREAD